jgi:hypothetical protein
MNKSIKAVLNNPKATPQDYFELVNVFDLTELSVQGDNNATVMSMLVNQFENIHNGFSFAEKCTTTYYTISNEDIKSISGKMIDGSDTLLIKTEMKDGSFVHICIYHTDTNTKAEIQDNYEESDVISLLDYLNKLDGYMANATVEDSFGMGLNILNATVVIEEESEKYRYNLHITNGTGTTFDIPLVDDCCNEVFFKHGNHVDSIMIRPYGQPFVEIRIVIARSEQK